MGPTQPHRSSRERRALYSPAERRRRDSSRWTLVQGILAPVQFLVFIVSAVLIARYLLTGEGFLAASISIVVKTLTLYTIMVTGAIWEKEVFGQYLLAPAFFYEDLVSFGVIALHTLYLASFVFGLFGETEQMLIAVAAYLAYLVNAAQFLIKLRMARLDERASALAQAARDSAGAQGNLAGSRS